jgi:hypothetical protein
MTADYDPIPELQKFGYTEREAAFLYLVGIHSGYFLRRQYLAFIRREDGAMVQRFLEKAVGFEHVSPMDYAAGRHIYHLKSKLIYRILGQEDSQNRRIKGDRQIKARLMQVDYVLDHFGEQFLETSEQKVRFFADTLEIPMDSLPRAQYQNAGSTVYFPDRFPVSVKEEPGQSAPKVSFAFIDDGLRSISAFVRFLEQHAKLVSALHHAEVIYTADSSRNLAEAEGQFLRRFPPSPASERFPYGVGHFLAYLRIRTSYDRQRGGFSMEEMRLLRDGMESYTNPWHAAVLVGWKSGATNEARVRAGFEPLMKQISIKRYLLAHDYPVWSMKYRRAVL